MAVFVVLAVSAPDGSQIWRNLRKEASSPLTLPLVQSLHMGGCQNYGPVLDPYFHTAPNI